MPIKKPSVDFKTLFRHLLAQDGVRLEASSKCQLKCPACPTARGLNRDNAIGWGSLQLEDFQALLAANPRIRRVELSSWGEVVLNPRLPEILEHAHRHGVAVSIGGVNFNAVSDKALEAMVAYRLHKLRVAIDGATEETYQIYRQGGSLARVLDNVNKLKDLKARHGSPWPKMIWQFVVFGHNEHEIALARQMARELGMEFRTKIQNEHWVEGPYSPVKDPQQVRRETGLPASREEFVEELGHEFIVPCLQLWTEPQVNWDGKLLGCCDNTWGGFGDAFRQTLAAGLKGERYLYAQRMVLGQVPARPDIPCVNCYHYRRRSLLGLLRSNGWRGRVLGWLLGFFTWLRGRR